MNVFVLSPSPRKSAELMCDRHVVKMTLETAQILSTGQYLYHHGGHAQPGLYKPTHKGHPCVLGTVLIPAYRHWVYLHGLALADEYELRYGKTHKSRGVLEHPLIRSWARPPSEAGSDWPKTWYDLSLDFPMAMPDVYKQGREGRVCEAYRAYYIGEKTNQLWCKWATGRRNRPPIFKERVPEG